MLVRNVAAFALLALSAIGAHAWDGVVSGQIARIEGVGSGGGAPGNFDFRVFLQGQGSVCSGATDPSWAYLNTSDANYKTLVGILLTAQASGKTVTLFTNRSSGYCQIGYVMVAT